MAEYPQLRSVIPSFLKDLGYRKPPEIKNERLWHAMLEYVAGMGVALDTHQSRKCFECGFTYAAACFPSLPLDAQVYAGIYTWLTAYIDDMTEPEEMSLFARRFYAGERQPSLLLQGSADLLRSTYSIWDEITAESIVISFLNFINANVLEKRPEFQAMKSSPGAHRFPAYFRHVEGLADAYAYFTFPKATHPNIADYIEAIPEILRVLNFGNDVCSFYKEEKAGVTSNYIHRVASYEGKDVFSVLEDATKECVQASKQVLLILDGKDDYKKAWLDHFHGYFHMHMSIERYRMRDLGLAEVKSVAIPASLWSKEEVPSEIKH